MRCCLILALITSPLSLTGEGAPDALFGTWGNAAQCAGTLIVESGSVLHSPVEIGPDWFHQRDIWCRLRWFEPQMRADGIYAPTRALCGEDAARGYWLAFDLDLTGKMPRLSLIWDEGLVNGPMERCVTAR